MCHGGLPPSFLDNGGQTGGAGAGGGSNLMLQGDTATIASGTPPISISYQTGVGEPPPTAVPEDKQACKKGGYEQFGFKKKGQCIKAVNHAG